MFFVLDWRFFRRGPMCHCFFNRLLAFRGKLVHSWQCGLRTTFTKLHLSSKYFGLTFSRSLPGSRQLLGWSRSLHETSRPSVEFFSHKSAQSIEIDQLFVPHHQVSDCDTHRFEGPCGHEPDEIFCKRGGHGLPGIRDDWFHNSSNNSSQQQKKIGLSYQDFMWQNIASRFACLEMVCVLGGAIRPLDSYSRSSLMIKSATCSRVISLVVSWAIAPSKGLVDESWAAQFASLNLSPTLTARLYSSSLLLPFSDT